MAILVKRSTTVRLALAILAVWAVWAQTGEVDEYRVKAMFLLNFARFVEWPAQTFKSPEEPVRICTLGDGAQEPALEQAVRAQTSTGRAFVYTPVTTFREACGCHIVFFLASGERKRARAVLGEIRAKSILTVGEGEDFLSNGGVVRFKLKDARVRFEIDAEAAARSNLKISSKLMTLADNARK
jgi:hypothetical protein